MFHEDAIRVEEISKKRGISMAQVSMAWSLTQVTAPIVGCTSIEKLEDLISACQWRGLCVIERDDGD
jgi:aryl-alcohol dehydrogenase-like predicted oxidoreductase